MLGSGEHVVENAVMLAIVQRVVVVDGCAAGLAAVSCLSSGSKARQILLSFEVREVLGMVTTLC